MGARGADVAGWEYVIVWVDDDVPNGVTVREVDGT